PVGGRRRRTPRRAPSVPVRPAQRLTADIRLDTGRLCPWIAAASVSISICLTVFEPVVESAYDRADRLRRGSAACRGALRPRGLPDVRDGAGLGRRPAA